MDRNNDRGQIWDISDSAHWEKISGARELRPATVHNPIVPWLLRRLPPGNGTCLEIGCFPGQFLPFLGSLGYELHGIDIQDRTDTDLPEWLRSRGHRTGEFIKHDFLQWKPGRQYDVVCSFGFIEHFDDWETIFNNHAALVKPDGLLVVTTPNFRVLLHRFLHWTFNRQNLKTHNLKSMRPKLWVSLLNKNMFDIQFSGPFGPFLFWTERKTRPIPQRVGLKILSKLDPLLAKLPENSGFCAPCCGLIAKRRE